MKFTASKIPAVVIIEPRVFSDSRGFFFESYHEKIFKANGIRAKFVQDNHSRSGEGTLRGLHTQTKPMAQAKLVRVVKGKVFDVAVDLRKGSKTYGKYVSAILSAENKKMIFIPEGFAHGFLALEPDTEVIYKTSNFYSPKHEIGFQWNDPAFGIPWPKLNKSYRIAEKDKHYPPFQIASRFKS